MRVKGIIDKFCITYDVDVLFFFLRSGQEDCTLEKFFFLFKLKKYQRNNPNLFKKSSKLL